MATITKHCRACGKELHLAIPEQGMARLWGETLGVLCTPCSEAEERAESAAKLEERRRSAVERCGLPPSRQGQTWEEMDTSEDRQREAAVEAAKAWAEGQLSGLLLCGPVGTGKSRLAQTAVWARAQAGLPVRWVSVARLVAMDKAGFGSAEKQEASKLLTSNMPLALDDLDKVTPNDTIKSLLFLAIDNRVSAKRPLLVTTNLKEEQLVATFGEAINSRLTGYCKVFVMAGRDRRKTAA